MRPASVSVPGKLILMGEHAVVYGRPALATAVDRRLKVEMRPNAVGRVRLDLRDFGTTRDLSWNDIVRGTERAVAAWHAYAEEPSPERFAAIQEIQAEGPEHVVRIALGRGALRAETNAGVDLHISSEIPLGSGFGSSAAVAVGVVAALRAARGESVEPTTIAAEALEVERCQHGRPSGIDTETVVRGGLVWAERCAPDGPLQFSSFTPRSSLLDRILVYDTGRPEESTGEVVSAVRARRDSNPAAFERALDRMTEATRAFRTTLESSEASLAALIESIRIFEMNLEMLGAVPPAVAERARQVERAGGALKVSGAGASRGNSAGTILALWPTQPAPESDPLAVWTPRPVRAAPLGLQIEE